MIIVCDMFMHVGLWNLVFLGSNVCLFLLLPFAYFFYEAEGLPGTKKVYIIIHVHIHALLTYVLLHVMHNVCRYTCTCVNIYMYVPVYVCALYSPSFTLSLPCLRVLCLGSMKQ